MGQFSSSLQRFVFGLVLLFGIGFFAHADGIEGTFRLVKRQLPDGTMETLTAVAGMWTMVNGHRQLNVSWHTPEGKPASASLISTYRITSNEYTETLIYFV